MAKPDPVQLPPHVPNWENLLPRLVVFVRTFGGPASTSAEDVAHDIVAKAHERWSSYDGTHAVSTWVYTIARNHCIDLNRAKRRRELVFQRHAETLMENQARHLQPEVQLERHAQQQAVAHAVAKLKLSDQRIVFLRYYEDASLQDISVVLGIPVGTVKYRIHAINRMLRSELSDVLERGSP